MTHDELLAEIELLRYPHKDVMADALRAAVELHKPRTINNVDILMCNYCDWNSYPCGTIQKIEEQLK